MRTFNWTFLLALPLAFVLGCGDGDSDNTDPTNPNPDCTGSDCEDPDPDSNLGTKKIFLHAVTPDIVGNFYACESSWQGTGFEPINCRLLCGNTSDCKVPSPNRGEMKLVFSAPNYLFLPHYINIVELEDGTTVELNWDEVAWGLAPNGAYIDSENGKTVQVETRIYVDQILISLKNNGGQVIGDEATNNDETFKATISEDLKRIDYRVARRAGMFEGTLTLAE